MTPVAVDSREKFLSAFADRHRDRAGKMIDEVVARAVVSEAERMAPFVRASDASRCALILGRRSVDDVLCDYLNADLDAAGYDLDSDYWNTIMREDVLATARLYVAAVMWDRLSKERA